jgi:hypothetical protein
VIATGITTRLHNLIEPPSVFWLAAGLAVFTVIGVLWVRGHNE